MARKVVYCPYCAATNGAVKKAGALKIIHDKFRAKKTAEELEKFKESFRGAVEAQKELGIYVNKAVHEDLNPLKVLDLFKRISDEVSKSKYTLTVLAAHLLSSGLRAAWTAPRLGKTGRVYLAVYLSSTRLHSTIRRTGRRV